MYPTVLVSPPTKEGILFIESVKGGEPFTSERLLMAQESVEKVLFGKETTAKFSTDFPAETGDTNGLG